jgi:twitching motility protein PilT
LNNQKEILLDEWELDLGLDFETKARFRINIYKQRGSMAAAFRLIPKQIRSLDETGLPPIVTSIPDLKQGLILVTGPTGHGKSTTLAAFINMINFSKNAHIITIEDPIEFVYPPGKALISQRELNSDTKSWNNALKSVLREDPDVVLVGEMRDLDTMAAAITIAETGHLVFATLHTNSASRTLAFELLFGTPALRAIIREGKTHMIDNLIQTSAESGMLSLESSLAELAKTGKITAQTAQNYASHPEIVIKLLGGPARLED